MNVNAVQRLVLKQMGRKGGLARKARVSKERLSEIGRLGAIARWAKVTSTTLVTP